MYVSDMDYPDPNSSLLDGIPNATFDEICCELDFNFLWRDLNSTFSNKYNLEY